ncbi:LONG CHAIN BASE BIOSYNTHESIS PROTEIN 1-LIKE [Salix purpurea]|uniref:LONG CHAIN BASE BIOSYNTHESIS PROTEIN 1-LIKE n=1 Tax=Salix purpurea TaxID=77065 RepID=A0A9Q0W3Z3_SALPP|nr:LONG CHAIN BASE BIOSYNTHESIS PROTEIN 1-LIKE [Salix purpurea]
MHWPLEDSALRLSSSGYVFSASLPPYLACAAITAIDVLEDNPALITKLKENISTSCCQNNFLGLSNIQGLSIASNPESPIVFLKLEMSTGSAKDDLKLLEAIADRALKEDSVFVATSKRSYNRQMSFACGNQIVCIGCPFRF